MNEDDNRDNPLHKFLNSVRKENNWPAGYKDSEIYKAGFSDGRRVGYDDGVSDAHNDTRRVIQSIDNIISLWKDTES